MLSLAQSAMKRDIRIRPKPAAGKPQTPPSVRPWWPDLRVCLLLLVATLAVYSQVRHYDYVNYDDADYVGKNMHVRAGLTAGGLVWALTSFDAANWFPLTWIAHMADTQLFGMESGWHHLTNVWLHALAALLLFAVLKRMTGARWPSALVAFLFALHPLHVESVAWVAERKDVLSAVFWFLTLWCYARYVERPGPGRYLEVVLAFCAGLMAKPMIVTLPFVLLLLDVWPLGRVPRRIVPGKALLREKLPLLALAAGASVVTYLAQRHGGAVAPLAGIPLALRIENALVSYVAYIGDMFWPAGLAVFYPHPHAFSVWRVAAAGLVLAGISLAVARQFRRRPYLAVGWCWYVGTLVPVIGLVQVGGQSRADRYTYVPMIGLSIMLAWGLAELVARRPRARKAVIAAVVAACSACVAVTWFQIQYWATSETLFRRALDVTSDNFTMHNNLAEYYLERQRNEEARDHASEAVRINPYYIDAHVNLATALSHLGRIGDSEMEYRKALELQPANVEAHSGLGAALAVQQRTAEALAELQTAVRLKPEYADGHYNLGKALASLGRNQEAAAEFAAAVRLEPDRPEAHHSLAIALADQGRLSEAVSEFAAEAQLRPGDADTEYNLAIALARSGRLDEAIVHFSEALRLRPGFEAARQNLETARSQRNASPQPAPKQ
jgi:tetratricopeptide (TPR) repeat protein